MPLDESFMSMGIFLPEAPSPAGNYRPVVAWAEMGVAGIETAHAPPESLPGNSRSVRRHVMKTDCLKGRHPDGKRADPPRHLRP